jgi:hypothetical protein
MPKRCAGIRRLVAEFAHTPEQKAPISVANQVIAGCHMLDFRDALCLDIARVNKQA